MPIRKVKGGWKIKNTSGISKTKKAAKRRLRAIKYRQSKRRRKGRDKRQEKRMRAIKLLSAKEAAGNSFANGSTINGATKVLCTHTGGTAGIINVYNAAGTVGSTCNLLAAGSGDAQIIIAKKSTDVMSATQGSIEFTACLTEA